ncbi:MAG: LysR family transcriptional regulator [Coriobacteriia bacterium]|nr:LysR family transcriptional regulator [Coriobacteriia bacterium]
MDMSLLAHYVAFSTRMSFTEAAADLHITQSALSKQISALESEIGTELVERTGKNLRLTHAGTIFLEDASAIVSRYNATRRKLKALSKSGPSHLTIGARVDRPFLLELVSGAVSGLKEAHAEIQTRIWSDDSVRHIDSLSNRAVDALLCIASRELRTPEFLSLPLFDDRLAIIVNKHHKLAGRSSVFISELEDEALLSRPNLSSLDFRWRIEELCSARGFAPSFEMHNLASCQEFFLELGNSILPWTSLTLSSIPESVRSELSVIAIEDEDAQLEYRAFYLADCPNPALPHFLEHLAAVAAKLDVK